MSNKIYVGNLSFNTQEDSLRETFSAFGTVDSAKLITDRDTGRSKGFAFIEMSTADEAQSAIAELNGKELDGRTVRVNEAQDRRDNGGNRGGSRW